jgi:predicted transcriptional regulator of viral defense system
MANQVYLTMYVLSEDRFTNFVYDGITYKYIQCPTDSEIDIIQSSINIHVTSYEQTLVDCIDRIDLAGGSEELIKIFDYCHKANSQKILTILQKYNKKTLYQKLGYIFEKFNNQFSLPESFFEECKNNISKHTIYLFQDLNTDKAFNENWNIIAPKD